MKIIEQSVRLIYPRTIDEGVRELKLIEIAGRNCWRSEEKTTDDSYKRFVKSLIARGHGSPLEFGAVMLDITTSRDVMAELTRHRIGVSFAIESQRYVNENKEDGIEFISPDFYIPASERYFHYDDGLSQLSSEWENAMSIAEACYQNMIFLGAKNQDARKVLPNSTACRIMMKVNIRELLTIYELRSSAAAYPEMRTLMKKLKHEIDSVFPDLLPDEEKK